MPSCSSLLASAEPYRHTPKFFQPAFRHPRRMMHGKRPTSASKAIFSSQSCLRDISDLHSISKSGASFGHVQSIHQSTVSMSDLLIVFRLRWPFIGCERTATRFQLLRRLKAEPHSRKSACISDSKSNDKVNLQFPAACHHSGVKTVRLGSIEMCLYASMSHCGCLICKPS